MKYNRLNLGSLTLCSFALMLSLGCSSEKPTTQTGDSGPSVTNGRWPVRPATALNNGEEVWFETKILNLAGRSTDCENIGFNLDQRVTTESTAADNSCRQPAGGGRNLVDGKDGLDNSLGCNVLRKIGPLAAQIKADPQSKIDQAISQKKIGLLLRLSNYVAGQDNSKVDGALYYASGQDAQGRWLISPFSLTSTTGSDPIHTAALNTFEGYTIGNTWYSGEKDFTVSLVFEGVKLSLPIKHGIVMFDTSTMKGTIAGLLRASDIQPEFERMTFKFGGCSETLKTAIDDLIKSAQDLVIGAPNFQDTSKNCDSISMGIGLESPKIAKEKVPVALGTDPTTEDVKCNL